MRGTFITVDGNLVARVSPTIKRSEIIKLDVCGVGRNGRKSPQLVVLSHPSVFNPRRERALSPGGAAFGTGADFAEMVEGIDAGAVAVRPGDPDGVAAHF